MINYQCLTCKLCMVKRFVTEHKWLTGHKKIIRRDIEDVAKEAIETTKKIRRPELTNRHVVTLGGMGIDCS